ncbi:tRNA glutamyl-Q(34) synthetase GluQRS [Gynuella sunshinyii]|uniref:Glutamyl-Q tRNA(Asp) synthetase n=1 Tax=Gynuella sunshinyii YC6258 TaxID=1445510 RepID=A0A0C5VU68_9GAMM|nr:tRNA glutamyl-Q(34) synthetase GluQRS [Gynuella sunshinyii]AJQ97706.1 glutamyl- and glutaminyl-tRNA synthetase [Gynuella sunshinyii YC6258]
MSEYRGRFAPSPTGPLHIGSLFTAVASYLHARQQNGKWLVRIEDIDPPREVPGASDDILRTLERFGLYWDESVIYQSQRHQYYLEAIEQLRQQHKLFWCRCSRKELESFAAYPGYCHRYNADRPDSAIRIRTDQHIIHFSDLLQGPDHWSLAEHGGDFVIRRRDGLFAYQLAVCVDDHAQHINTIVRGIDLYDSTCKQIYLQQRLNYHTPIYAHLPVLVNRTGQKLSKQTFARPVNDLEPRNCLLWVLKALGLTPDSSMDLADMLPWATQQFDIHALYGQKQHIAPDFSE